MSGRSETAGPRRPRWARAFLAALRSSGNVSHAARAARVLRTLPYKLRESHPDFAAEWDDALDEAADLLEEEARRRAVEGVRRPVLYQGQPVLVWADADGNVVPEGTPGATQVPLTECSYSDNLLAVLLRGCRPEKYRDNVSVTGPGKGGAVVIQRLGGEASPEDL